MVELTRRQLLAYSLVASWGALGSAFLVAQKRPERFSSEPSRRINTTVAVELLTADGVGINAREWAELFEELDVQLAIRKSVLKEIPETTEELLGASLRDVHVVGRLERDGSITFADRRYTTNDIAKVREWMRDLKAYGAQGTPKGQPMWGLTKSQFEPLFVALAPLIQVEFVDQTLEQALQSFTVREKYQLRYSALAAEYLRSGSAPKTARNTYLGLSEGTVLAALLNEFGLGYYPRRTPEGKIDLMIVKLGEKAETWPAGWPPDTDLVKLRPIFFQAREVELTDEPLLDVVQAIGDIIEVPILIDEHGLKFKKIDVRTKKVSHKKKKAILSAALKHVCYQGKCKYEFRMDEAGHPILWLTADAPPKEDF